MPQAHIGFIKPSMYFDHESKYHNTSNQWAHTMLSASARKYYMYFYVDIPSTLLLCSIKHGDKATTKKVSVSTNPTDRILKGRPQTFFTPPQKTFCMNACTYSTCICSGNHNVVHVHARVAVSIRN